MTQAWAAVRRALTPVWMRATAPDPSRIATTCPICVCLVAKDRTDRHAQWHKENGQ